MSLPQVEKSFQPTQSIGVRIRDLPESCTDELLFTQVFQKLNIDIKKVKAMKVKGHKTFQNCLGDAIVFFDTEDAAQDAMSKIIGTTLHEKVINCSRMMAPADLKLKNGKNVYVKNIKSGVTLQEFLLAAQKHGTVLSVILKENSIGKLDGYANYISSAVAEEAQKKGITIVSQNKEVVYAAKVLTAEGRDAPKKGKMPTIGRNIELHFDAPLVNGAIEVADFENQLREQISKKFNLLPTSIFVWGTRARHFSKNSEQTLQDAFNLVNNEATKDCGAPNAKGEHGCYNNPVGTTCPVLNYFHKKAFVCFETKAEAQELLNQFYGKYITESAEDKTLFDFTFTKGEETVTVKTERCIPENSSQDKKFKELEERLNPKIIDKNYIFLKNLKKDVTVEDVTNAIQGLCAAKVQSVKLSVPTIENFIKDPSKPTETKFATIYLDNKQEAEKFISQFKQNPDFREKFQIFEGYKYANYLAPKKIHLQDLKNKNNNQNKRQQAKPVNALTNQLIAQYMPNFIPFQKFNPNFFPKHGAFPTFPFNMGNKPFVMPQNFPTIRGNNQNQGYRPNSQPPQQFNRHQNNQPGNIQANKQGQSYPPRPFNQSAGRSYNPNYKTQQHQHVQHGGEQKRYPPHHQQNRNPAYQTGQQKHFSNDKNRINKNNQHIDKKAPQQAPIVTDKPTIAPKSQIAAIPKIEDIKDKSEDQQKQILGLAILPRITAALSESNKDKANKIAGMLVDFEIYTAEEIIEMLSSPEELKENIDTALELIQEQTQQ